MSVIPRAIFKNFNRRFGCTVFINRSFSSEIVDNDCLKSRLTDVELPRINFAEHIFNNFARHSDKVAVQCAITRRKYTYDEILVKSTNLNKCLRKKLQLQKSDVVALLLPNIPEYPIAILGTLLAGLRLTTINPTYTSDEIKRQLLDCNAKVVVTLAELYKNAKDAVEETNNPIPIVTIKHTTSQTPAGAIDFQELINTKHDIPDVELPAPEETIFMPYSSGTTGLPKGVELSSYNIVSNIAQMNHPELKVVIPASDTHQEVTIAVLPFFHIYGFTTMFTAMREGAKIVTLPKFTPDDYIMCLKDFRPHLLMLVPPIVIFLYSHPEVKAEYLSSLRVVNSGAAPLGALDEEKLRQKIGKPINILQGYGLSETSPLVTMVPYSLQGKFPGSMGTAAPNTLLKVIDIEDPEGKHLGPNKTGELLVKGPQVMKGYYNKPEETKNAFLNGWFRTGDLVRYDDHGMFYIADRIKELIKVKGLQVPPAELEEIIRDYPGVAEAAVIGIPHEFHGEVPRAYVVQKPEHNVDVNKLRKHVESKVAKHKRLDGGIVIIDNIPKNASGKILRRQLKLKFQEQGI